LLRITEGLASADRGSLAERWYHRVLATKNFASQVAVGKAAMAERQVALAQDRTIDIVEEGSSAGEGAMREIKHVSGKLDDRSIRQMDDLLLLIGHEIAVKGDKVRTMVGLVEMLVDPRGVRANAAWMEESLESHPSFALTFEIWNHPGQRKHVAYKNRAELREPGLSEWLGEGPVGGMS